MKSTGIVRKIDELGRIVLPMELRRTLNIGPKDGVEIFVDQDAVILRKFNRSCVLCGERENLTEFKDKLICPGCIDALKK